MLAGSLREDHLVEVYPLLVLLDVLAQNVRCVARRLQHYACRVGLGLCGAAVCRHETERSLRTYLRVEHGLRHGLHLVDERKRTIVAHEDVELVELARQRVCVAAEVVRKLAVGLVLSVPQEVAHTARDIDCREAILRVYIVEDGTNVRVAKHRLAELVESASAGEPS